MIPYSRYSPRSATYRQRATLNLRELPKVAKRSFCRYLMVKTTAAHFSLRRQKIVLANPPSPGQPITTNPGGV